MATAYQVIAQAAPAATTDTTLYTVPASTSVVASSLVVCNRGTTDQTFRIAVRPDGVTLANQHYLFYDTVVYAKSSITLTIGLTADAADVVTVRASSADLSFSLFGSIIT
jgi:hypothetical protein